MEFTDWEPIYEAILADFGYERSDDERARDVLASLLEDACDPTRLGIEGQTVAVAGPARGLEEELAKTPVDSVFAVSNAAAQLREVGTAVDCMVTDLDKTPAVARELTAEGTPVAVHAHGDNVALLREYVPEFEHRAVIPTTQAAPLGAIHNFGGFTDGDRAAFLADALGAERLVFPGWDFDDPDIGQEKQQKLQWAERLLYWLEAHRNEQFDVLDGRRDDIEMWVS